MNCPRCKKPVRCAACSLLLEDSGHITLDQALAAKQAALQQVVENKIWLDAQVAVIKSRDEKVARLEKTSYDLKEENKLLLAYIHSPKKVKIPSFKKIAKPAPQEKGDNNAT